jgi:hypothetical protein
LSLTEERERDRETAQARSQAAPQKPRDELRDDILSLLLAQQVEVTADYARRGRAHRNLANVELVEAWKAAFRAYSREPGPGPLQTAMQDFQAELDIRQIALPFDSVREEMDRLAAAAAAVLGRLKADPEHLEDVDSDLRTDVVL